MDHTRGFLRAVLWPAAAASLACIAMALPACSSIKATIRSAAPPPSIAATAPVVPSVPSGHAAGGSLFASCSITTKKDAYGNPLWSCSNAPYGYRYWVPPADARGDWRAVER